MEQGVKRMKKEWKPLAVCLAIPLAVGGLSALLSGGGMSAFSALEKPPLSPPGWLFPVVWTVLYLLMGYASYLVYRSGRPEQTVQSALTQYGLQLAVNFLWPILFFRLGWYTISFFWLIFLWGLIWVTLKAFSRISGKAGTLLIPYLVWVTFAGYLNLGIAVLN